MAHSTRHSALSARPSHSKDSNARAAAHGLPRGGGRRSSSCSGVLGGQTYADANARPKLVTGARSDRTSPARCVFVWEGGGERRRSVNTHIWTRTCGRASVGTHLPQVWRQPVWQQACGLTACCLRGWVGGACK
eukprot:64641-Chlamydomonas_euryale.AAC.4